MPFKNCFGGGGVDINGIVEQYKVATGNTISAGDFVQFIKELGETRSTTKSSTSIKVASGNSSFNKVSSVQMSTNTVVVFYDVQTGSYPTFAYYAYANVVIFNPTDGSITVGTTMSIATTASTSLLCVVKMDDSHVLCTYATDSKNIGGTYLKVVGTTLNSICSNSNLFTGGAAYQGSCAVQISSTSVLVMCSIQYDCRGVMCFISTNSLSASTPVTITSDKTWGINVVKISDNKVLFAYSYLASNPRAYRCRFLYIDGTTVSSDSNYALLTEVDSASNIAISPDILIINESTAAVFYVYTDSTKFYLYLALCSIDGSVPTVKSRYLIYDPNAGNIVSVSGVHNSGITTVSCCMQSMYNGGNGYAVAILKGSIVGDLYTQSGEPVVFQDAATSSPTYMYGYCHSVSVSYASDGCVLAFVGDLKVSASTVSLDVFLDVFDAITCAAKYANEIKGVAGSTGVSGDTIEVIVPGTT